MKDSLAERILFLTWVLVLVALFRPELHGFDTVGYYSWLRAFVIQGNPDVTDTFARYGFLGERGLSPTGYRLNEWPVGPALFWLPFFLLGHLLALAGRAAGLPVAADGYSPPYLVLTGLGSAVYAFAGLVLVRRLARTFAGPAASFWAAVTTWLGTPLVFYASAHPFMSHAVDFFINAAFLKLWAERAGRPWLRQMSLGLVGGLATAVRYQNATLLVWPALEAAVRLRTSSGEAVVRLVMLGLGALIGFLPQMVVWRLVFGSWVVLNPYGVVDAGTFDFRSPHFFDVLFSTERGLFTWTPPSALALLGLLGWLLKWRPGWAWLIPAQFLVQVYLVGSWSSWSGGAAFGARLLVGLLPGLGLGLAALYEASTRRRGTAPVIVAGVGSALWNLILLARYGLNDIPRAGPVPPDDLWLGQLTFLLTLGWRLEALMRALLRLGP